MEVGLAQSGDEREPGSGFVVIGEILLDEAAGGRVGNAEVLVAAVVEDGSEEIAVVLAEAVEAGLDGVARDIRGDGGLGTRRSLRRDRRWWRRESRRASDS